MEPELTPASAPPEQSSSGQSVDQATDSRNAKVIERFGGDPKLAESLSPSISPAGTAQPGKAPASGGSGQGDQSAEDVHLRTQQAIRDRISRKRELERLRQENEEWREFGRSVLTSRDDPAAAAPAKAEDPEPDFDQDPRSWYLWRDRQSVKAIEERLSPLTKLFESQEDRRQQEQRQAAQQEQFFAALDERRETMEVAEELYAASPQGQGYQERLDVYAKTLLQRFRAMGYPDQPSGNVPAASALVGMHLNGMVVMALQHGFNPAAYVDSAIRAEGIGAQAPAGPVPERKPAPTAARREETQALEKAARSGLAGSLSQGGVGKTAGGGIASLRGKDRVTVAEVREAMAREGIKAPNARARLRALLSDGA